MADSDTREFEQLTAEEQEVVEDKTNSETQEVKYAAVKEEITRDLVKTEVWTGRQSADKMQEDEGESPPVRLMDLI